MRLYFIACVLFFYVSAFAACAPNITPAERIITLSPHLAALVTEVGAGQHLIAVSVDSPEPAQGLPVVADYHGVDIERVVAFHPDLILAWQGGTPASQIQALRDLHQPVVAIEVARLSDIPRAMSDIACLTGTHPPGVIKKFQQEVEQLRANYANAAPVSVFFQVWSEPVMTVNGASIISDAIRLCGGRNIFASLPETAPVVSVEAVLKANPQVMIGDYSGWERLWASWDALQAVRNHALFTLPAGALSQGDARIIAGLHTLCDDIALARLHKVR